MPKDEMIRTGMLDYARRVVERFGSEKFICGSVQAPYWAATGSYMDFRGMIRATLGSRILLNFS